MEVRAKNNVWEDLDKTQGPLQTLKDIGCLVCGTPKQRNHLGVLDLNLRWLVCGTPTQRNHLGVLDLDLGCLVCGTPKQRNNLVVWDLEIGCVVRGPPQNSEIISLFWTWE